MCESCDWHQVNVGENTAVESWHDHAVPGWRELPIVPAHIPLSDGTKLTRTAEAWSSDHYPIEAQFEGAPIITQRSGLGTRHVPGRSPWGGYDLSQTALPPEQRLIDQPKPDKGRSKSQRDLAASPAPTRTRSVDGPSIGF